MPIDRLVGVTALTESRDDYGVLPPKANQLMTRLRRITAERLVAGEPGARQCAGTLDRLRSFLLQVQRMHGHEEALLQNIRGLMPQTSKEHSIQAVHEGSEACTDFESLLFHGKAALDRLTAFVAASHGQKMDRFVRLQRFLADTAPQTRAVKALRAILLECDAFKGTLVDDGDGSLRSRVTHRASLTEGVLSNFTIVTRPGRRALVLDCEAFGYGVLTQSRNLAADVPFLVLNALKLYLDAGKPLAAGSFRQNRFPVARVADYATEDESKPYVRLAKIEAGGVTITNQHVDPALFRLARRI